MTSLPHPDHIDTIVQNWQHIRPEQNFSDMELATRIWRIATLLLKHVIPVINKAGLNQGEFDVLATLYRHGGSLSPTALYQRLLITSGAITNRLDTLSQKGLIQRIPNPADKRSLEVMISNEGRLLFEPLLENYLQTLATCLEVVSQDNRPLLNQNLRQLLLNLEDNA